MDYSYADLSPREKKKFNIIAGKYGETTFDTYKKQENIINSYLNAPEKFSTFATEPRSADPEGYFQYISKDPNEKFSFIDAYAMSAGVRPGAPCAPCQTAKRIRTATDILIIIAGIVFALSVIKLLKQ